MGVLTEYFSASSDESAASALDRAGGPGQPSAGPPPLPAFDTFTATGLDPHVIMGKLEAALTGQDYRTVTASPYYAHLVAQRGDQGPWVTTVSRSLQAALSVAGPGDLARTAAEWSQAEELAGASPETLTSVLDGLAGLAGRATARNEHLYCWVSL